MERPYKHHFYVAGWLRQRLHTSTITPFTRRGYNSLIPVRPQVGQVPRARPGIFHKPLPRCVFAMN